MKIYISKSEIHCGPCSFINLVGLKGNLKLEEELSSIGRLKPFYASDYTSFLIWAQKYKKTIEVYTTSKKISNKMIDLMVYYEKIPKNKIKKYEKGVRKRHELLNKKYSTKIHQIKNAIQKLNSLLDKNYEVAVLTSDFYTKKPRPPVPHWIVAYKRKGGNYYFKDSGAGFISLTKWQLEKGFKLNKKVGFNPQLVAYRAK